jgi:hypothetical protein
MIRPVKMLHYGHDPPISAFCQGLSTPVFALLRGRTEVR